MKTGPTGVGAAIRWAILALAGVGLFLLIDWQGQGISAPIAESGAARADVAVVGKSDALMHVLLALVAIIIAGYLLGRLFKYLGQPPVIGEVIAGILLGPSLLGWVWPQAYRFILPPSVGPFLGVIAQIGVILYMFLVGLELNLGVVRARSKATVLVSHASIVAPFVLGAALALYLYPRLSNSNVSFTSFALFLGVAMSITAFPVLARILTDRKLQRSRLGSLALSCAAVDDVTAWCLLALVVGVAKAQVESALVVVVGTAGFVAFMFLIARPLIRSRLVPIAEENVNTPVVTLVIVAALICALTTEFIGIHAIFGAFLLGALIPHDSGVAQVFTRKFSDLVTVLFLPAFFAYTGMRTQIGLISGIEDWLICGLIIFVATAGKFGGAIVSARLTGLGWRESAALGALMNTRGLMELIVLNIGLDLGVISPRLFAMMVIMALVTTMATTPVLHFLEKRSAPEKKSEPIPAVAAF